MIKAVVNISHSSLLVSFKWYPFTRLIMLKHDTPFPPKGEQKPWALPKPIGGIFPKPSATSAGD